MDMMHKTFDPEILERRQKVLALMAKHLTESEIAQSLGISQATVSRDEQYLRYQSKTFLDDLAKDLFVFEYQQCLEGLDQVGREGWLMFHDQNIAPKVRITVLAILKDCYESKFRMLSEGPTVVSVKKLGDKVEKLDKNS
jgi:transcriptional regulator with XRE-family HTH domain